MAALSVRVDWLVVARAVVRPQLALTHDALLMVVVLLGTTISPYLFFWQAAQEVEDKKLHPHRAGEVRSDLRRIWLDTLVCMGFSNVTAFCIMLGAAATLYASNVHEIRPRPRRPKRCGR